jgi:predicted house-cleaning NTP pyrophosphatase (Maf/HAM1 superfamily)
MSDLPSRHPEALLEEIARLKAENARLKTEVQHLMVFCNCTLIPNKELQAKVERLTKAGDTIIQILCKYVPPTGAKYALMDWRDAKEGKPRA